VAATFALLGALLLATLKASPGAFGPLTWPVGQHWKTYLTGCCGTVLCFLLLAILGANLISPGDATPLPYVPLLNPLELVSVFSLLVALRWHNLARAHIRTLEENAASWGFIFAGVGVFFLTMAVARAVHHWAGVPFDLDALSASATLQTSLSIVWGLTGLSTMVIGARIGRRTIWLAGAALMAVVVVKLFLVELDNSGTVGRVISFLGVGVLLLIVGYFAPVPPRLDRDAQSSIRG
jgi:uncharacterized membrane protein